MPVRPIHSVALVVAVAFGVGPLPADEAQPAPGAAPAAAAPADPHPELRRLSPTDEIWLDLAGRRVVVGGSVALDGGGIEVFACPTQSKEHEAIVVTRCPARLVHAGLLAIGLEPGKPVTFFPTYEPASGPKVKVAVRWQDAERRWQERPAQEWIRNSKTGEALAADWVFAGSAFYRDNTDGKEYYQADGGDMICVSNFDTAMLDLPIESGNANEALLFEIFPERVPPRGTRVELVLSPGE